ncbi:hypothetical protein KSS87_022977 [Heliosperma pusillum]|nr:hypothetical protein KSS87_022977 [Heliosperma pusillum]
MEPAMEVQAPKHGQIQIMDKGKKRSFVQVEESFVDVYEFCKDFCVFLCYPCSSKWCTINFREGEF